MNNEIKEISDKFDKVLENYELDKKWGQMSVDSICHLFPSEMIIIKDYITNLQTIEQQYSALLSENAELQEELKGYKQERENLFKTTHDLQKEIKRLENKLSQSIKWSERRTMEWLDYKSRCEKLREYINTHKVSDTISFPLMKKDQENQVKSCFDYEFNQIYKKDLENILNGGENND